MFVAAAAALAFVLSAATAFAAPVLQPGTTSYPGMSGTCTDCHTYAKAVSTTPAAPKATVVSHTYAANGKHHATKSLFVWGYISPKLPNLTEATLTVVAARSVGKSWVTTTSMNATGTVASRGRFKNKTNYTAKLHLNVAGRYRLRAKLVYTDAKGVEQTKWSKVYTIRIYK
jgi:hypothetical protein